MRYIFLCLFLFTAGCHISSCSFTPTPNRGLALRQAVEKIESGALNEASLLLDITTGEQDLEQWVLLNKAKVLRLKGDREKAIDLLRLVSQNSAAGLAARVELLQSEMDYNNLQLSPQELIELNSQAVKLRQKDTQAEIKLLQARIFDQQHKTKDSLTTLQQLRKQFSKTQTAKEARKMAHPLVNEALKDIVNNWDLLISEIELLLTERQLDYALELTQTIKQLSSPKSAKYYQALILEEKIVRSANRKNEADYLLAEISASKYSGIADPALLKSARIAWNAQNNQQAMVTIENLFNRFPKSPSLDSAYYYKARMLEEKNDFLEAKAVYQELNEQSKDILTRIKAVRSIAWLALRSSSFESAASYFSTAAKLAKQELARLEKTNSSAFSKKLELLEEQGHSLYWQAKSLQKLNKPEQPLIEKQQILINTLLQETANLDPFNYYSLIAAQALNKQATFTEALSKPTQCIAPISEEIKKRLSLLKDANLAKYAQYEIDWYLNSSDHSSFDSSTVKHLTRASLYAQFYNPAAGLSEAALLLSDLRIKGSFQTGKNNCGGDIIKLAYPHPFANWYQEASAQTNVPVPLLLAITRTESAFDPQARSHKDALGLMQLLQETAEMEGMTPQESLYDPRANIFLGAKHLARLLKQYNGNKAHAIAAYNAGAQAVDRWNSRNPSAQTEEWIESIGYAETRNYVKKVMLTEAIYTFSPDGSLRSQALSVDGEKV